jgi:hypothetical protein
MTPKQFDQIANDLFGAVLGPLGFSNDRSEFCTFHRKVSDEVYHVVYPGLGTHGTKYDVYVFPTSPALDPLFDQKFPDSLGIPTDSWSYLSVRGVGLDQEWFNCKSEENLRQRFDSTVKPLLLTKAIPYLDQIRTVQDMLPLIKHPSFLALAMHHVGRIEEAKSLLQKERDRLAKLDQGDKTVSSLLSRVNQLLNAS